MPRPRGREKSGVGGRKGTKTFILSPEGIKFSAVRGTAIILTALPTESSAPPTKLDCLAALLRHD